MLRAIDQALAKSLLERRVTAKQLASAVESHVADGRAELCWFLEPLKAIANFDDVFLMRTSLPPQKALSSIPVESIPPMILFAPESLEFLDAVTLVPAAEDDTEGTMVTIPAPPRTR
jgi:hypothetical protein